MTTLWFMSVPALWVAVVIEGIALYLCLRRLTPALLSGNAASRVGPPVGLRIPRKALKQIQGDLRLANGKGLLLFVSRQCPACANLKAVWPDFRADAERKGVPVRLLIDELGSGWEEYSSELGQTIFTHEHLDVAELRAALSIKAVPYVLGLERERVLSSETYRSPERALAALAS